MMDQDYVIDVTKKVSLARFINHCCEVGVNEGSCTRPLEVLMNCFTSG